MLYISIIFFFISVLAFKKKSFFFIYSYQIIKVIWLDYCENIVISEFLITWLLYRSSKGFWLLSSSTLVYRTSSIRTWDWHYLHRQQPRCLFHETWITRRDYICGPTVSFVFVVSSWKRYACIHVIGLKFITHLIL